MIYQLVFAFFMGLSLLVLPACTLFGGSSEEGTETDEEYYSEEEGEGSGEEGGESEDSGLGEGERDESLPSDEGIESEDSGDSGEEIHYIDEEEEDLLDESAIIEDDTPAEQGDLSSEEGSAEQSVEEFAQGAEGDDGSGFFDSSAPAPDGGVANASVGGPSESAGFAQAPAPAPVKKWLPYRKIKTQTYTSAGVLVNAVYIARAGENMQGISANIFGSDKTSLLYAINPHLKVRSIKVGDKVYYPSPLRPQDSSQLLFYFEDKGVQPSIHQAQAGENIRNIAQNLLGDTNSWKEIWATNPELESKGELYQARAIRYWPISADQATSAGPPQEQAVEESPPSEMGGGGGDIASSSTNPPEGMDENVAPPPMEDDGFGSDVDDGPPALPPESGPASEVGGNAEVGSSAPIKWNAQILIAVLLAVGAVVFLILLKRKKQKADFDYTAVNYEINE